MENQYVKYWKGRKTAVKRKIYAAVSLVLVSVLLLSSASYAWLVLSTSPELSGVDTTIGANGNLEIALGKNIGKSAVGDSFDKTKVTQANRTWGNLIDLTDASYGLQEITLRPAMLNAAGGAVNTLHPFSYPVYGSDGRVEKIYANDMFAGTYNHNRFVTSVEEYGVRGIGVARYTALGTEDVFGPLSQRQEVFDQAYHDLWQMMQSSYKALCRNSQSVLMAYCYYGTGVSASDFSLDTFSKNVDAVVSAANEELRLNFTLLAAAEMTASEDYFKAMELLEAQNPSYETVWPLVDAAIQDAGVDVGAAISELRAFQNAAAKLKAAIASEEVDGSDGYSMEEIAQTVGLIFDLEKTNFSIDTVIENKVTYNYTYNNFYSNVISGLYYQIPYHERKGWDYWEENYSGSSVYNLTSNLDDKSGYQDNDSREYIADEIIYSHMYPIHNSLKLAELDQAIISLYVSHWGYWEDCAEDYQSLQERVAELEPQVKALENTVTEQQEELAAVTKEIADLDQKLTEATAASDKATLQKQLTDKQTQAESIRNRLNSLNATLLPKATELADKKAHLQSLLDEKIYAFNDSRLETIRTVMEDTIEALRQYTLWSIAYFACDGQIPDDAYHRMLEIANSPDYIHPRTAYRALCNYGVTPVDNLAQMVESYEKLEQELLFLQNAPENAEAVSWPVLNTELQRVFGTITHHFAFLDNLTVSEYSSYFSPEDTLTPTKVLTEIRNEIQKCETAISASVSATHCVLYHNVLYDGDQFWEQALGLLNSFYQERDPFGYGRSNYTLENRQFTIQHNLRFTGNFRFDISIGVGTEDNFNESGLTVRQTRFQTAQENISYYQNQLITAAVNVDKDLVTLLMQMIAGQNTVSLVTISDYLGYLQQQLDYGEAMMYQAALAMAASDYADDTVYGLVYSGNAPKTASGLITLLQQYDFDKKVLNAFAHRMERLDNLQALLNQSVTLLKNYQDPETGALTIAQIPIAEAAALLSPVLDTGSLTLYGYVEEEREPTEKPDETIPPSYLRTVLYTGFGSPSVQISGKKATIKGQEPITMFADVYLSVGRSLSGSLLAFAKPEVETYAPPAGSVNAEDIVSFENGMNRHAYAMGTGESMFTLNLCTADTPYALATNLWMYTGNTDYISANYRLVDLYGYCIDLSLRTNAADSDLLLQTEAANRIYNDEQALTDTTMGAGSYMEFTTAHPSYSPDTARQYMACIRVAITDTNTGYIYGYAALDMAAAEVIGTNIKAPLRMYDKDTGIMVEGNTAQYICHLEQNLEKNLTVYVYLDGAKTTDAIVSALDEQSLYGVLNLQFCSSADLNPAVIEDLR